MRRDFAFAKVVECAGEKQRLFFVIQKTADGLCQKRHLKRMQVSCRALVFERREVMPYIFLMNLLYAKGIASIPKLFFNFGRFVLVHCRGSLTSIRQKNSTFVLFCKALFICQATKKTRTTSSS